MLRCKKSLTEHLQEAGLVVRNVVVCDRRILGFKWEHNEMVPVVDPSLEETSEVWMKLDDPSHKAGEAIGCWFGRQFEHGLFLRIDVCLFKPSPQGHHTAAQQFQCFHQSCLMTEAVPSRDPSNPMRVLQESAALRPVSAARSPALQVSNAGYQGSVWAEGILGRGAVSKVRTTGHVRLA